MVVKLTAKPDTSKLIVEDDEPVDSQYAEKQQRLLTEPLHSSWTAPDGQPFMANSNVGLFFEDDTAHPFVPDAMLTLNVPRADIRQYDHRSFFVWIVGKVPDVVIEIVSIEPAGEDGVKMRKYQKRRIPNYVVYDPLRVLGDEELRIFRLVRGKYARNATGQFPELGLSMKLWEGEFEGCRETWLRWCDPRGRVIPTGREGRLAERAARSIEKKRADELKLEADDLKLKADEAQRAREATEKENRRLIERLREMGIEP